MVDMYLHQIYLQMIARSFFLLQTDDSFEAVDDAYVLSSYFLLTNVSAALLDKSVAIMVATLFIIVLCKVISCNPILECVGSASVCTSS